jgi:ATP-binding cassette subfamily B protein
VQLLLRMMDVTEGKILIDGKDIRTVNLAAFKQQVGYAPQDVFLFSDTIANNISFGLTGDPSAMEQLVEQAATHAALTSTISDFPHGFDTVVGERGITLSGGQKQRVSIARALIRDPELLIFDDCLSAIDNKTEAEILAHLQRIMRGKTAFIISHRVSSVKDAGHILVLDKGQVQEAGTHKALLAHNGRYMQLYQRQLMEETADA